MGSRHPGKTTNRPLCASPVCKATASIPIWRSHQPRTSSLKQPSFCGWERRIRGFENLRQRPQGAVCFLRSENCETQAKCQHFTQTHKEREHKACPCPGSCANSCHWAGTRNLGRWSHLCQTGYPETYSQDFSCSLFR
jgi:hypothetical protein